MRSVYIYCDGGFGNRFNALVSGLVLAKTLDLSPQIVWPVNNWCGAAFGDLLESDLPVLDREVATFVPERQHFRHFLVEDRLGLQPGWTVDESPLRMGHWDAVRAHLGVCNADVFYYTALIPPFMAAADVLAEVRGLRLRRGIIDTVDAFLRDSGLLEQHFFGVQIRKTDFGSLGADEENLFDLLSKSEGHRFFVCSDDQKVEARFCALANVTVHRKSAYVDKLVDGDWTAVTTDCSGRSYPCNVNRNRQSVLDAVADLLILSHSQIVTTSNSTFLKAALLLQASR